MIYKRLQKSIPRILLEKIRKVTMRIYSCSANRLNEIEIFSENLISLIDIANDDPFKNIVFIAGGRFVANWMELLKRFNLTKIPKMIKEMRVCVCAVASKGIKAKSNKMNRMTWS